MKLQWMTTALLGSALVVGCGDRGNQNSQDIDPNAAPPAATAPAGDVASHHDSDAALTPNADISAAPTAEGARPTTGNRTTVARPAEPRASARPVTRDDRDRDTVIAPSRDQRDQNVTARNNAAARPVTRQLTVPAGTALPLELLTALSSETARVETPVRARLRSPITVDGHTAIPAGTVLNGTVTDVEDAGRVKGRAKLTFRFDEATVNGVRENLRTNPITFQAEATKGEDATKIGAGAGIGAAIGGIIGGGSGAAKGAAIGGAAGTGAVLATKGRDVEVAAGTDLSATLANDLTVTAR